MAKALLNYTTEIPVDRTIGEITKILVHHGAAAILAEYDRGQAVAVSFSIKSSRGLDTYKLPARVDGVFAVLQAQRKSGKIPPRYATREQAARVGWRIVKDWIEAQLALVSAGMVEVDEVLLPYMLQAGRTFFEKYVEARQALPGPEPEHG